MLWKFPKLKLLIPKMGFSQNLNVQYYLGKSASSGLKCGPVSHECEVKESHPELVLVFSTEF